MIYLRLSCVRMLHMFRNSVKKMRVGLKIFYFMIAALTMFGNIVTAEGSYQTNLTQWLSEYNYAGPASNFSSSLHPLYVILNNSTEVINVSLCGAADADDVRFEIYDVTGTTRYYTASLTTSTQATLCTNTFAAALNPPTAFRWTPTDYTGAGSPLGAGTYQIRLYNDASSGVWLRRYDITVTSNKTTNPNPTVSEGRLYAYNWAFGDASLGSTDATDANYYVLVPGGQPSTNFVWQLDLNDFNGGYFDIIANNKGVNKPNSPFSVPQSGNTVMQLYPIYLGYPVNALPPPILPPQITNYSFVDSAGVDQSISPSSTATVQDSGTFRFTSDVSGRYWIFIDANQDGIFGNTVGTVDDVYLTGDMIAGANSVIWDGKNNAGTVLPVGVYQAQLQARIGEYHFIASDAETSGGGTNNGLTIYGVTTTGSLYGTQVFWDDLTGFNPDITGNAGSTLPAGRTSVVGSLTGTFRHTWGSFTTGTFGDVAYIDTYTYATASVVNTTAVIETTDTTTKLGVSKTATVSGNQITFDFYLENFDTATINTLTLTDNLDAIFGVGNYTITPLSAASVISSSGTGTAISVNTGFNGSTSQNMLLNTLPATSQLGAGGKAQVRLVVTVNTFTDQGNGLGIYQNTATTSGRNSGGVLMVDQSTNSTDPDADPVTNNGLASDSSTGTNDNNNRPDDNTSFTPVKILIDLGDAPDAGALTSTGDYQTRFADNGPRHLIVNNLALGTVIDSDSGTLQDAAATADDTNGTPDDEDAVASFPTLTPTSGATYTVSMSVTNSTVGTAYLVGYIDFNKDGDFLDSGEKSTTVVPVVTSATNPRSFNVSFTTPIGMTTGTTYARFRISNTQIQAESSVGASTSGEVEDYLLTISSPIDYGDAPDTGTGTGVGNYQTLASDGGPSHIIVSGLSLGTNIDADSGTLQNVAADADDTNGTDDEDGVVSIPTLLTSATTYNLPITYTNSPASDAYIVGYIDLNRDGDFSDSGEQSATLTVISSILNPRPATLVFSSLSGLTAGDVYMRLRISNSQGQAESSIGASTSGEVEDYMITITGDTKFGSAKALDRIIPASNSASNNTYTLVYRFTLENFSLVALSNLEIFDDVVTQFSGLSPTNYNVWISVPANAALLSPASTLTLNGSWNGTATSNILTTGQSLAAGQSKLVYISFNVTVNPVAVAPNNTLRDNSATVTGTSPLSIVVTDVSTNGLDPDGTDGDNDPDETEVTPASYVKLIKEVRNCGSSLSSCSGSYVVSEEGEPGDYLEYRIRYYNISSQAITTLLVSDTLVPETPFQEDTYGLTDDFSVVCPDTTSADFDRSDAAVTTTPAVGSITAFEINVMATTVCNVASIAPAEQGYLLFKVKIP